MKNYLLFILLTFVLTGCEQINETEEIILTDCGTTTLENTTWIQNIINGKSDCGPIPANSSLTSYEYNSEIVFCLLAPAADLGVCTHAVYDCSGTRISDPWISTNEWANFEAKRKNGKLLWSKIN